MFGDMLKERRNSSIEKRQGNDLLDQIINDMDTYKFLKEEIVVYIVFGVLLANFETAAVVLALAFKLVSEHPLVLEELLVRKLAKSYKYNYIGIIIYGI